MKSSTKFSPWIAIRLRQHFARLDSKKRYRKEQFSSPDYDESHWDDTYSPNGRI